MSDTTIYKIPDMPGHSSSVDPNLLLSMMNNGGFGGGNWIWIIFLFLLYRRNGYGLDGNNAIGTGYLSNQITNTAGRDLLMQAINGNGNAIQNLSNMLNSDINSIKCALNGVQSSINQVGNQAGMSAAQVTNAITTGNMQIAQQLAQCCCDNKLLVTTQGYENQLQTLNQTNVLQNSINAVAVGQEKGLNTLAYESQAQTCTLQNGMRNQTQAIINKLNSIEDDRKNRQIAKLTAQLTAANSRAERAAELAPITKALADIQCKQPSTVAVPYQPFVTVPNCVAWNTALYGNYPYTQNGSIWS